LPHGALGVGVPAGSTASASSLSLGEGNAPGRQNQAHLATQTILQFAAQDIRQLTDPQPSLSADAFRTVRTGGRSPLSAGAGLAALAARLTALAARLAALAARLAALAARPGRVVGTTGV
jgi:hypothetical protein